MTKYIVINKNNFPVPLKLRNTEITYLPAGAISEPLDLESPEKTPKGVFVKKIKES